MVRSTEQLESQLLTLPPADRARLAELLLASLDAETEAGPVAATEDAWRAEGERRLAELRAGLVAGVPAAKVFADASRRLSAECPARSSSIWRRARSSSRPWIDTNSFDPDLVRRFWRRCKARRSTRSSGRRAVGPSGLNCGACSCDDFHTISSTRSTATGSTSSRSDIFDAIRAIGSTARTPEEA